MNNRQHSVEQYCTIWNMNKHELKRRATIQALENAFWDLYCEQDISHITVKSITERSGVHRSTFYLYFEDVYSLLESIKQRVIQEWVESIQSIGPDFITILTSGKKIPAAMILKISVLYRRWGKYVSQFIGEGKDPDFAHRLEGALKPIFFQNAKLSPEDPYSNFVMGIVVNTILTILARWYPLRDTLDVAKLFPMISQTISGIISPMTVLSSSVGPDAPRAQIA